MCANAQLWPLRRDRSPVPADRVADAIVVETNQDGARLAAALDGVRRGMADAQLEVDERLVVSGGFDRAAAH